MQPFARRREAPAGTEQARCTPELRSACAAAVLRRHAQREEDGARMAESIEGVQIVSDTPVRAARLSCDTCKGFAVMDALGSVASPSCLSTGSCEDIWVKMHPEQYHDGDGEPLVNAALCTGFLCSANIRLETEDGEPCIEGVCTVDRNGEDYRLNGRRLMNNMPLTDPMNGFERYDGMEA